MKRQWSFFILIFFLPKFALSAEELAETEAKKPKWKFNEISEKDRITWKKRIIALEAKRNQESQKARRSQSQKTKKDWKKEFNRVSTNLKIGNHQEKQREAKTLFLLLNEGKISSREIRKDGLIPFLLALLRKRPTERESQLALLKTLGYLACWDEESQNTIREEGGFIEITTFLKDRYELSHKIAAATVLAQLVKVNDTNKNALRESGAIPLLVQAMDSPCAEIKSLSSYREDFLRNKKVVGLANGHLTFIPNQEVTELSKGRGDRRQDDLRETVALAFAYMADGNEQNKIALREAGAIPLLMIEINLWCRGIESSLFALRNLAEENQDNQALIVANKGLNSFILQLYNIHGLEQEVLTFEILSWLIESKGVSHQRAILTLKNMLKWANHYNNSFFSVQIIKLLRKRAKASQEQKKIMGTIGLDILAESILKAIPNGFIGRQRYLLKLETISLLKMLKSYKKKKAKDSSKKTTQK